MILYHNILHLWRIFKSETPYLALVIDLETPKMKLLLASNNEGKLREIEAVLEGLSIELILPIALGLKLEVAEEGHTYRENAALKAQAFARVSGFPALADDSGLEVDALGGLPGINSARFSPLPGATDVDRRRYLLQHLSGKPRPWKAQFRCVIALALPGQRIWYAMATCPGEIIPEERGTMGFGYDPIFFLPSLGKTMAELPLAEKNRLSHRALALEAIKPVLRDEFAV